MWVEKFRSFRKNRTFIIISILLTSTVLFGLPILDGDDLRGWDAPTHIFFASSYLNSWWDPIEPRWYGGYSKFSYPPLAHQLVAITTIGTGNLEVSYGLVLLCFLALAPYAIYRFSRCFVSEDESIIAAIIFVLLPSVRIMLFSFGQFAGFISLIFLLFASSWVNEYLRYGSYRSLLLGVLLLVCSVATHTNTTFFFSPFILALVAFSSFERRNFSIYFRRIVLSATFSGIAVLLILLPFIGWFRTYNMQVPIPHPSRTNLLDDLSIARLYFLDLYGAYLVLIPLIVLTNLRNLKRLVQILVCLFFLVLGLGGTTTLPSIVFGSQWEWLTYERFSVWAIILALPLVGQFFLSKKHAVLDYIGIVVTTFLIYSTSAWIVNPSNYHITPPLLNMKPIVDSFSEHQTCRERFLALGFGFQLPDLSTYSDASTLDGLWHTAREDILLRNSGVGALSDALYWKNGKEVLEAVLDRTNPPAANCIFVNENFPVGLRYIEIITKRGWTKLENLSNGVSLWTMNSIKQSYTNLPSKHSGISLYAFIWGVLPLLSLFAFLITGIYFNLKKRFSA